MPVQVRELQTSRKLTVDLDRPRNVIEQIAWGSDSETAVYAAVLAGSPAFYVGLALKSIDVDPQGGGVWFATTVYESPDGPVAQGANADMSGYTPGPGGPPFPPPPPGAVLPPPAPGDDDPLDAGITFTIGETQKHITQSLQTRYSVGNGALVTPDYKRAIGVTKDKIEGVDVPVGTMDFTVTRVLPYITLKYVRILRAMVGKANSLPFWGFDAYVLRFRGATFTPKQGGNAVAAGDTRMTAAYSFAVGENATNVEIVPPPVNPPPGESGSGLVLPDVRASDYVWVSYKTEESEGRTVEVPFAAYVERILDEVDYRLLGLTS